jgi:hypothetical protein
VDPARGTYALAGQPGRIVRSQEHNDWRDLVGLPEPASQRCFRDHLLSLLAVDEPHSPRAFRVRVTGATALTRMFRRPSSLASAMVRVSTAPLVAEYRDELGTGFSLAIELILMILPPLAGKCFTASWIVKIGPKTLASNSRWNSFSLISSTGPN